MTYFPDASYIFPETGYKPDCPNIAICTCGKTWYQGDAYDKKLTWAEKYYCRFCYKKAQTEKVAILQALPYEVARLMVDRGDFCTERVSSRIWGF